MVLFVTALVRDTMTRALCTPQNGQTIHSHAITERLEVEILENHRARNHRATSSFLGSNDDEMRSGRVSVCSARYRSLSDAPSHAPRRFAHGESFAIRSHYAKLRHASSCRRGALSVRVP